MLNALPNWVVHFFLMLIGINIEINTPKNN